MIMYSKVEGTLLSVSVLIAPKILDVRIVIHDTIAYSILCCYSYTLHGWQDGPACWKHQQVQLFSWSS